MQNMWGPAKVAKIVPYLLFFILKWYNMGG